MLRRFLSAAALVCGACSSDSPDTHQLELLTNATSYAWIPDMPPPPLSLTLHFHGSGDFLEAIVCSHEGTPTAPIQYQQRQEDGTWANIPFGTIVCNFPRTLVHIESGATWMLPPEVQSFPPDSGTYRIVLQSSNTSVDFPIVSNSFTVEGDFEPTS